MVAEAAKSKRRWIISITSSISLSLAGTLELTLVGMALRRIGTGAQNSLLKALLTSVISAARRGTGFGLFYTGYGIAWFLGSAAMGLLYDKSILAVVIFSILLQLLTLPVLL